MHLSVDPNACSVGIQSPHRAPGRGILKNRDGFVHFVPHLPWIARIVGERFLGIEGTKDEEEREGTRARQFDHRDGPVSGPRSPFDGANPLLL